MFCIYTIHCTHVGLEQGQSVEREELEGLGKDELPGRGGGGAVGAVLW